MSTKVSPFMGGLGRDLTDKIMIDTNGNVGINVSSAATVDDALLNVQGNVIIGTNASNVFTVTGQFDLGAREGAINEYTTIIKTRHDSRK